MNETAKIKDRVSAYTVGNGLDIGCYDCKVTPNAFGIDGREVDGVNLVTNNLYDLPQQIPRLVGNQNYVFSSHCLEHLHDSYRAIKEWSEFIKSGGYLILYLPEGSRYKNEQNEEHLQDTRHDSFMLWFTRTFCGQGKNFKGEQYLKPIFKVIEHGIDPEEEDLYSFYLIAQKL